jgi:hypothetical protein
MIYAIMRSLGLRASEADLPIEAYAARAFTERDALYQNSLRGTVRIAEALEAQTRLLANGPETAEEEAPGAIAPTGTSGG